LSLVAQTSTNPVLIQMNKRFDVVENKMQIKSGETM